MATDPAFLGRGWAFPPRFALDAAGLGQVAMVAAEADIRESLLILLSTMPGERLMQPSFGCALKAFVFANIDTGTMTEIEDAIRRAVLFFEPRITLHALTLDDGRMGAGQLDILLEYTVRLTNTRSNMVFPFYFLEGSNVAR